MISLQTNVNSLVAQQNLSVNNMFQSRTIAQLTSGYRINQSGDDAAGLAIANKYRSSIAELTQGVANGNDGVAQLQIMDGGMNNIAQILDRLKTLATQSASGTITDQKTRDTLNSEFQTDLGEIDRQAQSIGLNTAGSFAKSLSVYLGAGTGSAGTANSSSASLVNSQVTVNLTQSAVDSQSLGLKGLQAVNLTDIGVNSATSVQNIITNSAGNDQAISGHASIQFSGAGFADAGKQSISVNLSGVTDVSTLATAVNSAIQQTAQGSTSAATAFKTANIIASVHTDSATGAQSLAFTSSTSAFQVQAGDQIGNALLGNVTNTGTANAPIATGVAVTGAGTLVTGATTTAGTFAAGTSVNLVVTGGGLAAPVTLKVNTSNAVTTTGAIQDLETQFASNTQLQAAGLTLSGSSVAGAGRLSFNNASGQSFNVQVTGDSANLLGLGSFLASGVSPDYNNITAGSAYGASTVTGNLNTVGSTANLQVSLNGQAAIALAGIDLTAGTSATTAKLTGSAPIGAGGLVDITNANKNLNITVINNGVATNKVFALNTNVTASSGAEVSTLTKASADDLLTISAGTQVTLTAANNHFTVAVDGGPATAVSVTAATYSSASALLSAIQTGITSAGLALTASYDATSGALTLTSNASTGVLSKVTIDDKFATAAVVTSGASLTGGTNVLTSPVTLSTTTNQFSLAVDGHATVQITVSTNAGNPYTDGTALAAAIQAGITAATSATNGLVGVTATWDSVAGKVAITSPNTGVGSYVTIDSGSTHDGLTTLGFAASGNAGNSSQGSAAVSDGALTNLGFTAGTGTGAGAASDSLLDIAAQIETALGAGNAKVTVNNDNTLSIASISKGANSSVTVNNVGVGSANSTLHFADAATQKGANSSTADVVSNLNAQFATGALQSAGLKAYGTDSSGNTATSGNFLTIVSNNGTQFRLNSVGSTTAATAASIASTTTSTSTFTAGSITVGTTGNNKFDVTYGGATVTVTVASGTYSNANSFLAAINTGIHATTLGASSVAASYDATTGALTLSSGTVAAVTVAASGGGNTGLANFGLDSLTTVVGQQGSATEDLGFGAAGASFTSAALTTAGANPSSASSTISTLDANGISESSQTFAFQAMQFGSDKQAITFSAADSNGALQTKTVTLQNNLNLNSNRAGASIDDAVAYINQQLQADTSQSAMQQIVAVKENVSGQEQINFVSKLSSFTVGIGSTANGVSGTQNGDGLNFGIATNVASKINGTGSNISIDTQEGANAAILAISNAVSALGEAQAAVGKGQNQLTYAIGLAQSQITNFSAAESQIRDTNVAQQAANLSKAQTLSQASIAAMAQANSATQGVLALLRG